MKGKKGRGVSIKGRCTLDHVVSLNKRMTEYQTKAVMGIVLGLVLKYCMFEMAKLSTCPCEGVGAA